MPIFLAIAGILLIVAGVKGREKEFLSQVTDDGKGFIVWFLLILIVGIVGISKTWRPVSNAFLVLIVIAFILGSGNAIIAGFKQLSSEK
jgi:ABC-type transport system involved in cytochrome c biogenesis permease subunit